MIALLLSTTLSLFLFISFGFFITKFMKNSCSFVEKLLIGIVACNTVTTCISLFLPINIFVLIFLIILGLFFVVTIKNDLKPIILTIYENKYIILCSLSFISIAFLISLESPNNYDTGLYHLQSIKWIEEYPVVPSLANLHGRFGFNPNIFTLFAVTSIHHLFNQEIFSINFTVFAILVFYFVNKLHSLFKQQGITNLFVFYTFLFLMILKLPNLSSPSPDFISTVITLFIFARMLDLSDQKVKSEFKSYIPILVLSVYIVTVKLSAFPILLLFIFVFIKYKSELRKSLWLVPIVGLILIPWLARNIVTSGWLIYPFPSIDLFSFDWKVPVSNVINEKEAISGWARNPGVDFIKAANMSFVDWFQIWWQRISFPNSVIFLISIVFPLIGFISQLIKKTRIDLFTNAVIMTSFLGVIFWFFLAPDWRFGEAFILIAAMSPFLFLKSNLALTIKPKFIFFILLISLLGYYTMSKGFIMLIVIFPLLFFKSNLGTKNKSQIIFVIVMFIIFMNYMQINSSKIKTNSYNLLFSQSIFMPSRIEIPANLNYKIHNINGVYIYVPTKGDQCFDHNIPCTPFLDTSLVLRKNTLNSGFKHAVKSN